MLQVRDGEMDYSRFRFRAEVDYITIRISLSRATNKAAIRDWVEPHHNGSLGMDAIDEGPQHQATVFDLTFNDPKSHAQVNQALGAIRAHHEWATLPKVTAIEIALDAYSNAGDINELAELAYEMYRGAEFMPDTQWGRKLYRTVRDMGRAIDEESRPAIIQDLLDGFNVRVGHRDLEPHSLHIYVKRTDKAGRVALPAEEQRARFEVKFQGEALADTDLERFRISTAIRPKVFEMYKFRELDPAKLATKPAQYAKAYEESTQIGERRERQRKGGGGTRLHMHVTRANAKLNKLAADALRRLMKRWEGTPTAKPCGNLRSTDPARLTVPLPDSLSVALPYQPGRRQRDSITSTPTPLQQRHSFTVTSSDYTLRTSDEEEGQRFAENTRTGQANRRDSHRQPEPRPP